ncbi:MAG TPA: hypothetical protein VJ650_09130 [Gemmatimonadaceae bacterium]|nr:hypothetical protein [Gemmatimonadaceae bacterium]
MSRTFIPAALVACLACSDASGLDAGSFSMSFSANESSTAQTATTAGAAALSDITIVEGTNTLIVTRARLVLDEIELEEFSGRDCDNSGPGRDPNCPEIELGPFLVDLPLNGGVRSAISARIPAGSYHEIEFDVEPVDDSNAGARAFFAAHPDVPRNRSIIVEGTFNGQAFTFMSASRFELELEFEPNLVVGAEGTNVTIDVDVASWFRSGTILLNPLDAAAAAAIESRILASFAAFRDDNRDGRRDGGGSDDR